MFDVPGVSLLVLEDGRLTVAATSGEALSADELRQLGPDSGLPVSVGTTPRALSALRTIALTAAGRPVGMLALRGVELGKLVLTNSGASLKSSAHSHSHDH